MTWRLIFMLLVLVIPNVLCGQCKSSTHGKEFVFGILDMVDESFHGSSSIVAIDITNVSPVDTRVHLQIPYFNNNTYFNILRGQKKTIEIDPRIQKDRTFVDKRAIKILSDNEISVIVTNAFNPGAVIETYSILPVKALGNRYIISSFASGYSYRNRGSVLLVSGVYDNTHVTLYNHTSTIYATTVNSSDVFQYLCPNTCDMTGLKVISDKNVFVVSGSTFVYYSPGYDCLGAAMIPTSAWSNKYIVPPVLPGGPFVIRLLSEHSLLNATIANSSKTIFTNASHTANYFQNEPVVIVADQSFTVTQYGMSKSGSSFYVDEAFMAVVPGIDQYLPAYIFTVPKGYYNVTYYVAVIVPKTHKDGVLFDGIPRQSYRYSITYLNVPAPLDDYVILTFQVDSGFHHFQQTFPTGNFGLFVYGLGIYRGTRLGNGFYAGFNLKGECLTPASTTKTSLETTTVSTNTSSSTGSGQLCFVCADLSHIDLCDRVERCNQNEVCYLERYVKSGHTKYRSGCMDTRTCQTNEDKYSQSDDICFECCHSNYCNNKGCGEDIPDRDSRGPICFDCEHVSSPEECFEVFPCNSDQVCRIEEYKWFGHSNFRMGCGHGVCDPVTETRRLGLKRATPVCQSCCTDDFCNRNCTAALAGQGGSVIVG
ncbi:uncharacterized protein LOC123554510 [Mercenaria mercenaria]|uniref:uncharacterized protein LOC123554510 n=1 Tax=Mercenaria mercenaria TaxID=6596 RepID=UPI00234F3DAB|nr:uncharacterized protein LOC123554510 [Mercenaria mercenaria]